MIYIIYLYNKFVIKYSNINKNEGFHKNNRTRSKLR